MTDVSERGRVSCCNDPYLREKDKALPTFSENLAPLQKDVNQAMMCDSHTSIRKLITCGKYAAPARSRM